MGATQSLALLLFKEKSFGVLKLKISVFKGASHTHFACNDCSFIFFKWKEFTYEMEKVQSMDSISVLVF